MSELVITEDLPQSAQVLLDELVEDYPQEAIYESIRQQAASAAAQQVLTLYDNQDQIQQQLGIPDDG